MTELGLQVKIFDKNLVGLRSLYGHDAGITCLDVYQDMLVTGSADNSLKVWAVSEGLLEQELVGHTDSIVCVCVNAWHIVSSSEDDTIRVWDTRSGACTNVMKESSPIVLHPSSILVTVRQLRHHCWTISRAFSAPAQPHTVQVPWSPCCPCWLGADWCLESDVVGDLGASSGLRRYGNFDIIFDPCLTHHQLFATLHAPGDAPRLVTMVIGCGLRLII